MQSQVRVQQEYRHKEQYKHYSIKQYRRGDQ